MAMQERVPQKSETKNGNLNRSEQGEPSKKEGPASAGKSNDPECTLRKGSIPAASAVTTVDRDKNKGAAIKCAEKQNLSDGKTGKGNLAQIPAGKNFPTFVAVEDE